MKKERPYTESLNGLIDQFARLPGIGRRTAERLAFHLLKADREQALQLAEAIRQVKLSVKNCRECYHLTEQDPCPLCSDPARDSAVLLVVEQPRDVINLEQTRSYRGLYHVLLGHLSPLEGIGPGDLTIGPLLERAARLVAQHGRLEVILGTNPTLEGDGTSLYLSEKLQKVSGVRLTRLARGLPSGTQLEYANRQVLSDAILSRQPLL